MGRCCSGTRSSPPATSRPCAPPGATTALSSTRPCPCARWARPSATCCSTGSTAQPSAATSRTIGAARHRREGPLRGRRHQPAAPPRRARRRRGPDYLEKIERLLVLQTCPECGGARLRPEARVVSVAGRSIVEVSRLSLGELAEWIAGLQSRPARRGLADRRADRGRSAGARAAAGRGGPGLPDPRARHARRSRRARRSGCAWRRCSAPG